MKSIHIIGFVILLYAAIISPTAAAIGIYNWNATTTSGSSSIHIVYRLTCDGTVVINFLNEQGNIVDTIGPFSDKKGINSHDWPGRADGKNYTAKITATCSGHGTAGNLFELAHVSSGVSVHGMAVDTYESSPGYGTIYIGDIVSGGGIRAYYADGSPKYGFGGSSDSNLLSLGFVTGLSTKAPWGIAVDSLGRIYAASFTVGPPVSNKAISVFDYTGKKLADITPNKSRGQNWLAALHTSTTDMEVFETLTNTSAVQSSVVGQSQWNSVMNTVISGLQGETNRF